MEQIERTERYLNRIRSFYKGVQNPYHSINGFEDDVVSFFMHCYHIRDWVLHLNKKGLKNSDVDEYINSHIELRICADFCNGSKHCHLTKNKRTNSQPHLIVKNHIGFDYASLNTEEFRPRTEKANFKIHSNGEVYDALELAEKCFSLWRCFVQQHCT